MVTPVPALSFHDQGGFYGGASVSCLAAADLNGDGIVDLVTCDSSSGTLDVQLGNRTTGVAWPIQYPGGDGVAYVVVGDLNGGGIPDLVSTSHSGIGILLGTGAGQSGAPNYATPVYYPLSAPGPVAIADFNDDGNADILVSTTAGLQVWLGKGDGTFTDRKSVV